MLQDEVDVICHNLSAFVVNMQFGEIQFPEFQPLQRKDISQFCNHSHRSEVRIIWMSCFLVTDGQWKEVLLIV